MIRFNVTDSTPLIEFDVESNALNMSAEDVRPVTAKDYNQLNNKPSIEGVTLEGNISLDDIGVTTPLVGNSDDVTPAMVVEALASGRSVILTTEQTFMGMTETFRLQMTVGGDHSYALGTGVFNYEGTPYAITLMGTIYSTEWAWNVTRLALHDDIPNPSGSPPPMDGQGSSGTLASGYALGNHQHPSDLSRMIAEYVVPYYSTAQAYSIGDLVISPWTGKLFRAIVNTIPKPAIGSDSWEEVVLINEVQRRTNSSTLPMDSIVYRNRLLFRSVDGQKFVPANNSSSTNATAARTTIQTPIDPFGGIYYYGTTAAVEAGSRPSAAYLWTQYLVTLGYSFNRTGAALALTTYKPLYIKALPQASGGAVIDADTPYVQALPTTNDGYIYIYLGIVNAATTFELAAEHPVYYYDGTRIRHWS